MNLLDCHVTKITQIIKFVQDLNVQMKILALDENHPLLNDGLRDTGFTVDEDYHSPKEEILKIIDQYEGLIIRSRIPVDREFLEKAINLKFIGLGKY